MFQKSPTPVLDDNQPKYEVMMLELTNRMPSSFTLKGSADLGLPVHLDCPSDLMICPTSVVVIDGKRRKIRYIKGAESCFVDEQEKAKVEPNYMEDNISFVFGTLTVVKDGTDPCLEQYLELYEGNVNNPYRPAGAEDVFYRIDTNLNAEVELEDIDDLTTALSLVAGLRSKLPGGGFEYNEAKINYLSKLFNLVNVDSPAEKLNALQYVAKGRPAFFIEAVKADNNELRVLIATAREMSIITFQDKTLVWADQSKIMDFKSKNTDARVEELINYLISDRGAVDLDNLKLQVAERADGSLTTK